MTIRHLNLIGPRSLRKVYQEGVFASRPRRLDGMKLGGAKVQTVCAGAVQVRVFPVVFGSDIHHAESEEMKRLRHLVRLVSRDTAWPLRLLCSRRHRASACDGNQFTRSVPRAQFTRRHLSSARPLNQLCRFCASEGLSRPFRGNLGLHGIRHQIPHGFRQSWFESMPGSQPFGIYTLHC